MPDTPKPTRLWTSKELAKHLGCSYRTVVRLCVDHGMPHYTMSDKGWRIVDYWRDVLPFLCTNIWLLDYLPKCREVVVRDMKTQGASEHPLNPKNGSRGGPPSGIRPDWQAAVHAGFRTFQAVAQAVAQAVRDRQRVAPDPSDVRIDPGPS